MLKRIILITLLTTAVGLFLFFLVRPSEKERMLNKPFGYIYEDSEGVYFLDIESKKGAVDGLFTYYHLNQEDSLEPEIYNEYVNVKGAWVETVLDLTFESSDKGDKPLKVRGWMSEEDLFLREEGTTEIMILKPVSEKERDRFLNKLEKERKKMEKERQDEIKEAKEEVFERLEDVYGFLYEPEDDYGKWLLVKFYEKDKKGDWKGEVLAFDSPFINNGASEGVAYPFEATINTWTADEDWTFDLTLTLKKEQRLLKGVLSDTADTIDMNFLSSSDKMRFEKISEEEWKNGYFHEQFYRLSDLH